uniref:Uncharacterized protein n=1 Tax=Cacopsylla melanoneura TaxID=428564 RepID=A0A8D9EP61_9HEMI
MILVQMNWTMYYQVHSLHHLLLLRRISFQQSSHQCSFCFQWLHFQVVFLQELVFQIVLYSLKTMYYQEHSVLELHHLLFLRPISFQQSSHLLCSFCFQYFSVHFLVVFLQEIVFQIVLYSLNENLQMARNLYVCFQVQNLLCRLLVQVQYL